MTTTPVSVFAHTEPRKYIAPLWHTIILLFILAIPAAFGMLLQNRQTIGAQVLSHHSEAMLRFYLPVLVFEWLLVFYVRFGVRKCGGSLRSLVGGGWTSVGKVVADAALGLGILVAMLAIGAVLARVLGAGHAKGIGVLLPQGNLEMLLWIVIAATAGFAEELVYRGYLQSQAARLGLSPLLAITSQAIIFGVGHIYEGRNAVIVITVYALLFGAVAHWRKSLRPGIIGHTFFDLAVVFLMPR